MSTTGFNINIIPIKKCCLTRFQYYHNFSRRSSHKYDMKQFYTFIFCIMYCNKHVLYIIILIYYTIIYARYHTKLITRICLIE